MSSEPIVRCAKCGTERPAGQPCPKCLFGLGLEASAPDQLGSYRIVSRLGRGGMGEVYRAHDDRLDREVAIKVLPARVANDPERNARFRREARVAASLNHTNIAAVYGFEELDDDTHFLVMELVEGHSLADRLKSGPMRIDEALSVFAQVADGLESAHESGIVHRDLKPSNVMITPDGKVKILDFGLAKALDEEPAAEDLGLSRTASLQFTKPGMVIGTVPYMSPEQARGRPVDRRTDIWSLGCVLYECLAGKRAFEGDTATDVLVRIIEWDPSWEALPSRTPARLRELIERCLEKDPTRRLRDAGDLRIELERVREGREWTSSGAVAATKSVPRRRRDIFPWSIAGLAVVAAVVSAAIAMRAPRSGPDIHAGNAPVIPLRVDVTDPAHPGFRASDHSSVAVTADGMTIAYFGKTPRTNGIDWSICVRRADEIATRCVASPDAANAAFDPFFSPDGKWLGFSGRGLYKVSLDGASPTLITENLSVGGMKGAAWTQRGIVFSPAAKAGLMMVGENGGAALTLTVPDTSKGEVSHRWPSALPDGRHLLFTIKKEGITSFDEGEIALLDLDTKSWKTLIRGGSFARYLPTGHIVYARDGAIVAVPFDLRSEKVTGPPVRILSNVMTSPGSGAAQFAVASDAGAIVFVPGGEDIARNELVWLDRRGNVTSVGAPLEPYYRPILSPDGTRIASTVFGATDTVAVYDLDRRSTTRARSAGNIALRSWFPDGRQLLVSSDAEGGATLHLYAADADGTGAPRRLPIDVDGEFARLVVRTEEGPGVVHLAPDAIYLTRTEGGDSRRLTGFGETNPASPAVSPDGRWLAYQTNVGGHWEVYIRPLPTGNGTWQVSRGGGTLPHWSPRGNELVYVREEGPDRWLMSVPLSATASGISAGLPRDLVKIPSDFVELNGFAADGERFLGVRPVAAQYPGDRVVEILNWFDQVRKVVRGQ
ncbi:MAG TPA: protein kinase [Candidatus Polarisedimenticolaceae bacterium]|nr:protein kinase [Candidatus Polarisedimenticolaceae bacterium]